MNKNTILSFDDFCKVSSVDGPEKEKFSDFLIKRKKSIKDKVLEEWLQLFNTFCDENNF